MLEIIHPGVNARKARVVLFDFDGTISLIRAGWVDVMVPMMVEGLLATKSGETEEQLTEIVREYVGRLTGRQTMYQMIEYAEQIAKRGGKPEDPLVYKKRYLALLQKRIQHRIDALESGQADPEQYLVPGSRALLEYLKSRGMKMYLASGTDQEYMRAEARLLRIYDYFDGGVYGALDDYKSFSKRILIQRIIQSAEFAGEEFLGFGDGYVEIQNVKEVGGVAVGVATDEPACRVVDEWKRQRLIGVGADFIIPNYLNLQELTSVLFPDGQ